MPSRAHFLLKRRIALSRDSFSPTLTVDIDIHLLLVASDIYYTYYAAFVKKKRTQNRLERQFQSKRRGKTDFLLARKRKRVPTKSVYNKRLTPLRTRQPIFSVSFVPPRTCMWRCSTDWQASAPLLDTRRKPPCKPSSSTRVESFLRHLPKV